MTSSSPQMRHCWRTPRTSRAAKQRRECTLVPGVHATPQALLSSTLSPNSAVNSNAFCLHGLVSSSAVLTRVLGTKLVVCHSVCVTLCVCVCVHAHVCVFMLHALNFENMCI